VPLGPRASRTPCLSDPVPLGPRASRTPCLGPRASTLAQVEAAILSPARMEGWRAFVQNTLEFGRQQGQAMTVGVMRAPEIAFAQARGAKIDSPVIFVADKLLKSPKSARHQAAGDALTLADWLELPQNLAQATMAVWDTEEKTVVYLLPGSDTSRLAVRFGRLRTGGLALPDAATVFKTQQTQFEDYLRQGRYEKIR